MRRILIFLFACLLAAGCSLSQPDLNGTPFTAVITSDLHFTLSSSDVNTLVPLVSDSEEVLETIVNEVLDIHPDVFIMTGDLTNSGKEEDEVYLAGKLDELKQAGISVILTTGNHDFNFTDASVFERVFFPLFDIESRDPSSLSYTVKCGNVLFLAMDDSSYTGSGAFSEATMSWLKKQLKEARKNGSPVIFLSHHSVLSDYGKNYTIENKDLYGLLKSYGVRFCMSGHQHSQSLLKKEDMTELISAMPMNGAHLIGILQCDGSRLEYSAVPLDFETYGPEGFAETVKQADEKSLAYSRDTFLKIFADAGMDEEKQQACTDLMIDFMSAAAAGRLAGEAPGIRSSAAYDDLKEGLAGSNYGPWFERLMAHPEDSAHFSIEW